MNLLWEVQQEGGGWDWVLWDDGGGRVEWEGGVGSKYCMGMEWMEDGAAEVSCLEKFKYSTNIPHSIQEEAKDGHFLKYIYAHDHLWDDWIYKMYGEN